MSVYTDALTRIERETLVHIDASISIQQVVSFLALAFKRTDGINADSLTGVGPSGAFVYICTIMEKERKKNTSFFLSILSSK